MIKNEKMLNTIINGECIEVMKNIESKSIDMILCDLPYGTTGISWDVIIPFEDLWKEYERIITDNGAIVLTASQPFTTKLIASNLKLFRYEWIWIKNNNTGFANAKKMPMKRHENICVFYKHLPTYNPQGLIEVNKKFDKKERNSPGNYINKSKKEKEELQLQKGKVINRPQYEDPTKPYVNNKGVEGFAFGFNYNKNETYIKTHTNYPNSILNFSIPSNKTRIHPTEKPLDLWEYLIKTYTNEGMTVLDNCSGSGVTAEACLNTNRNYICIELDKTFYEKSNERIEKVKINLENKNGNK